MQPLFLFRKPSTIKPVPQTGLFFPFINNPMLPALSKLGSVEAPPTKPSVSFLICSCCRAMTQDTSPRLSIPLSPCGRAKFASKPIGHPSRGAAGLGTAQQRRQRRSSKAAAGAGMHRGPLRTRVSTRLFLCGI